MGTRDATYKLRLAAEELERWQHVAVARGVPLAELIRRAVNVEIGEPPQPAALARAVRPVKPAHAQAQEDIKAGDLLTADFATGKVRRARTTVCEHRNPPDAYCKLCDA